VTHLVLIAVMIDRFLDAIEDCAQDHQHIRYIAYGGAPVSRPTLERMRRLLPNAKLQQSYGMTEALGSVTLLTDADHRRGGELIASAGRALPGCSVVARRPDGEACAPGEPGELYIRVDTLMAGYWRNEAATAEAIQGEFYRSGDIGYVDPEGYIFVVDRAKDMIVSGGENVYSLEVERAIEVIEGVLQVAVIGIPSTVWGEQVHAIVVPAPGSDLTAEGVQQALRGRLAGYKCPKSVEIRRQPLPVSGNNKVLKSELRRPFWDNLSRAVN
jgi:long-chain acyl-CoA synthetase